MRVTSINGVSPMSERIAGARSPVAVSVGLVPSSSMGLLPFRLTVGEQLLQQLEANFAVVERKMQVPAFVDPGGWDPAQRLIIEALGFVIAFPRAGIGQDGDIGLIGEIEFLQHRAAIVAVVPG